ncbi:hypothetical protein EMA8858_01973 [Emticicia aquatica]|uniref:Uncharacterized protein n=1 Tax=Emticicia aquatica TaxID=1681835 RepID=A0ABM9AQ91_9BACT|nr:hypothetical protein EMA8858_01973 [Emticicia aquatica]
MTQFLTLKPVYFLNKKVVKKTYPFNHFIEKKSYLSVLF